MENASDASRSALVAHKVLNNNVVLTLDGRGRERVLMGRGLGFQLKPDDAIDLDKVQKTFVLDDGAQGARERQILAEVDYRVIEAVTRAVDEAERVLEHRLGRHCTMAIIDHVEFVAERLARGMRIPAASMPELRILHPREFAAAQQMVSSIARALDLDMPADEAAFVTMHLLNATRDEPDGTAALRLRRLQHVLATVERGLGTPLDVEAPDYARFVLHIQFLLQRLVSGTMLRGRDSSFFEFAKRTYPRSFSIAREVADYVHAATATALTNEELLYVVVHIERLAERIDAGGADGSMLGSSPQG